MRMQESEMREAIRGLSPSSNPNAPATPNPEQPETTHPKTPNQETRHSEELLPPSRLRRFTTQASTSSAWRTDAGNRKKIAKTLTAIGTYIGTAAQDRFDDSEFKRGKAVDFPEIPGEANRNRELPRIREVYNPERDADGMVTRTHSRANSPAPSIMSVRGSTSFDENRPEGSERGRPVAPARRRRATLEVPLASPTHQHTRNAPSSGSIPSVIMVDDADSPSSPTIVVSTDFEDGERPP